MKLGVGVRKSSPTIAMELFPISLSNKSTARIDIYQRMFNVKGTDTITWNYYYDLDIDFSRLGIDSAGKEAITTRTLRITNSGYEFLTGNVLVNDLRIITSKDDTTGNCSNSYSIVSEITSVKNRCSTLENNLNTLTTKNNELVGGKNDNESKQNKLANDCATLRNKVNSYHPN